MDKFVDAAFVRWKWDTNKQHDHKLALLRRDLARQLYKATSQKEKSHIKNTLEKKITFLKKERRNYRRSFELEWKFST